MAVQIIDSMPQNAASNIIRVLQKELIYPKRPANMMPYGMETGKRNTYIRQKKNRL